MKDRIDIDEVINMKVNISYPKMEGEYKSEWKHLVTVPNKVGEEDGDTEDQDTTTNAD